MSAARAPAPPAVAAADALSGVATRAHRVQRSDRASLALAAVGVAAVVWLALRAGGAAPASLQNFTELFAFVCIAQMWNLLAGYAGLVSIGQQGFIGIGAYTLVVLVNDHGVDPYVAVLPAGLLAAAFSLPTAALAFRLRAGYFAIGTWVIAEVLRLWVTNTSSLGGGVGQTVRFTGIAARDRLEATYLVALAAAVGACLVVFALLRSRVGTGLLAVRDSPVAAAANGVRVLQVKVVAWVVAAFGCGIGGAVIYLNLVRVQPDAAFSVNWTAFMIFIVVIGGIGTLEGPIVGAVLFWLAQEALADQGAWYLVGLGTVAVLMTMYAPRGLWGLVAARTSVRMFPIGRRLRLTDPTNQEVNS